MDAQLRHYQDKLAFEIDSRDLKDCVAVGRKSVVVDARSQVAYQK